MELSGVGLALCKDGGKRGLTHQKKTCEKTYVAVSIIDDVVTTEASSTSTVEAAIQRWSSAWYRLRGQRLYHRPPAYDDGTSAIDDELARG